MTDPSRLTALESAVLSGLLEGDLGDLPVLAVLRAQVEHATVRRREWTGVGFWTDLEVPGSIPRLNKTERFQVTGVYGRHPALEAGIGFALDAWDGVVRSLEGYTYEEAWPKDANLIELELDPTEKRLAALADAFGE